MPSVASHQSLKRSSSNAYMRSAVCAREVVERQAWFHRLLHAAFVDERTRLFKIVSTVVILLVISSVALVTLESVESIAARYGTTFRVAEYVVVGAFSVEYFANLFVAKRKREYVLSFWGLVDLLAILPSYLSLLNFTGVKIARTLRILRVLRILKLSKFAAQRGEETLQRRDNTFWIDLQIYMITLLTAVVLSSTLVYYAERDVPGTAFVHIPIAMWWAMVTITTTGYGDMAPVTVAGRIIAGATMLTGLALFGILTSVIGRAMLSSLFGHTSDAE
jgi:voltage-gated potassium channel